MKENFKVFRIHTRPNGGKNNKNLTWNFCYKNRLVGVGWPIDVKFVKELDWDTYTRLCKKKYKKLPPSVNSVYKISKNDLIWTVSPRPQRYYICKVISPWKYLQSREARDADIVNVVKAEFHEVSLEKVPPRILDNFIAGHAAREVTDKHGINETALLWNRLVKRDEYKIERKLLGWAGLTPKQAEDLVLLFLQTKGWLYVPSLRRNDTPPIEYLLVNRKTHQWCGVQVKLGNAVIDVNNYYKFRGKLYFFQSNNMFRETKKWTKNMEKIDKKELEGFIKRNKHIIPDHIRQLF